MRDDAPTKKALSTERAFSCAWLRAGSFAATEFQSACSSGGHKDGFGLSGAVASAGAAKPVQTVVAAAQGGWDEPQRTANPAEQSAATRAAAGLQRRRHKSNGKRELISANEEVGDRQSQDRYRTAWRRPYR